MSKNVVSSVVFLLFFGIYLYLSYSIPISKIEMYDPVKSSTIPIFIAYLGGGLSLLLLALSVIKDGSDKITMEYVKSLNKTKVLVFVLLMLAYGFFIRKVGFLISTTIFLAIGFYILNERRWGIILSVSIGVTVVFWLIITKVLGVFIV